MTPTLKNLRLDEVRPSKTNPRKDFESPAAVEYLNDIASTIRQKGILQPPLVRPAYCVGARSRNEIAERRAAAPVVLAWHELVFGECRWRASAIAKKDTMPCIVEEMTDDDAREAQQIENLQRRDLAPLEEAAGFEEMLSLKDDEGKPRYTVETLADKIGHQPQFIYQRRFLLQLPAIAKTAMVDGILPPKTARLFAPIAPALREAFAQKILKPELEEGPLSFRRAREVRDAEFMKPLKGALFLLDDAALVPAAGACLACPKMSGNCAQLFEGDESAHLKNRTCFDPLCYRAKIAALQVRQAQEAEKAGKKMLSPAEAEKIYPYYTGTGEMDPKSPYVQLGRKPSEHLLKKEVTKIPTWEKLIGDAEVTLGAKVPRVLIADQAGVVREHVDVKLAIAAIEKAGEPIFREVSARPTAASADDFEKQKKAEAQRAKYQQAVTMAGLDALFVLLTKNHQAAAVRDEVLTLAMSHAGESGLALIRKWRGLKVDSGEFAEADAVTKWAKGIDSDERQALAILLLMAQPLKAEGVSSEFFTSMASAVGIDVKAIEKKVADEMKKAKAPAALSAKKVEGIDPGKRQAIVTLLAAGKDKAALAKQLGVSLPTVHLVAKEEKAAAAKAKAEQPDAEARVRELRAQGKSFTDIFLATKYSQRKLKKLLAVIDAEKAAAASPKSASKGGTGK